MSLLEKLEQEYLLEILNQFHLSSGVPCALLAPNGDLLLSSSLPSPPDDPYLTPEQMEEQFEFCLGNLNEKNFSQTFDCSFHLSDFTKKIFEEEKDTLKGKKQIIGFKHPKELYSWVFPLVYFGNLLGFVAMGGISIRISNQEEKEIQIKLKAVLSYSEIGSPSVEQTLTWRQAKFLLEMLSQKGEEVLEQYNKQVLESLQSEIHSHLDKSYKEFLDKGKKETSEVKEGLVVNPQQWVKKTYNALSISITKHLKVSPCGISNYC